MIKKIGIGLAVLVVIVAGAVYFLASNVDGLIKAAIESVGGDATQAKVTVDKVKISLTSGEGAIGGLKVGNPKGFSTPEALSLGEVSVKLDVASVTKNPVVIKEIVISQPRVTYEHGSPASNLEAIQKNAQAYAAKFGGGQPAKPADPKAAKADPAGETKVVIENLYVRDGQIGISHTALAGKTLNAALPTIHLRDIGKTKGGASPAEVADQVLGTISASAQRVAVADLQKTLGDALRGAAGAVSGAAGAVGGAASGATQGVGDALRGVLGR